MLNRYAVGFYRLAQTRFSWLPFTEIIKIVLSLNMLFPPLLCMLNLVHTLGMALNTKIIDLTFYSWFCFSSENKKVFQLIHRILNIYLKMKMLTKPRGFFILWMHVIRTRILGNLLLVFVVKNWCKEETPIVQRIQSLIANWFPYEMLKTTCWLNPRTCKWNSWEETIWKLLTTRKAIPNHYNT